MTRIFLFLITSICFSSVTYVASDITGTWLNKDKDAHIQIIESNGKYFGKIIWLKTPIDPETNKPKVDKNNPKAELKTRPVIGLIILKNLVWDADDQEWGNGSVYDPKTGNNYSMTCSLKDKDNLELRGYLGLSMFGRTDVWTRVK